VAALLEVGLISGQHNGAGVLVIRPTEPQVAQRGVIETLAPDGRGLIHVQLRVMVKLGKPAVGSFRSMAGVGCRIGGSCAVL